MHYQKLQSLVLVFVPLRTWSHLKLLVLGGGTGTGFTGTLGCES